MLIIQGTSEKYTTFGWYKNSVPTQSFYLLPWLEGITSLTSQSNSSAFLSSVHPHNVFPSHPKKIYGPMLFLVFEVAAFQETSPSKFCMHLLFHHPSFYPAQYTCISLS